MLFFLWPKFKTVAISNKNSLMDIIRHIIVLSMSWELFDIDEAKQLKNQLVSYAEDKREFTQTQDELIIPPREYWKKYLSLDIPIYKFANKIFSFCPHSASVERLFSILGITKSKMRNRMTIKTLSKIAIVRHELNQERNKEKNYSNHEVIENDCKQVDESKEEQKSEEVQKNEISIFSDEENESSIFYDVEEIESSVFYNHEEIESSVIYNDEENKNESVENQFNNVNNQNEFPFPSNNLGQLTQHTNELGSNNANDSIDQYFNLSSFKEIVTKKKLKVRSSTNLDSFVPLPKKNNFTLDQILYDDI